MHSRWVTTGLVLGISLSSFLVACGGDGDTLDRSALERESLERELELALQPDTTQEVSLEDVPVEADTPTPPLSAPAPAPAPRPRQPASPPPSTPAPAPAPAPARPRLVTYTVPAGTSFGVRLDEEISTRSHPVGSTFTATLTESIYASNGRVLIPAGATVHGRVVDSSVSGRAGEDASLAVEFTSIYSAGESYSIAGSTGALPARLVTRDSRTEQVAKVGGGAVAGAILGRVLGGSTKSTVAGAAIGAAAGTAVAMGTADVDAVVDSGSLVTVSLNTSISVQREES